MVFETAVAWGMTHPYLATFLGSVFTTIFTTEVLKPTVVNLIFPDIKPLDPSRLIGYDVGQNEIKEIENQIPLYVKENEHGDLILTRNQVTDVVKGQLTMIEQRLNDSEGQLSAYQIELKEMKSEHDKVIEEMKKLEENSKLQNDRMILQVESHVSVTLTDYLNKEGISEKIDFIHTRLDKLENITGTLAESHEELKNNLKTINNNVTKKMAAFQEEVKELKKELSDLKFDYDVKRKKTNDEISFLQDQLQREKSEIERFVKNTNKEIERLRQDLSVRNIKASSELNEIRSVVREHEDKNEAKLNKLRELITNRVGEVRKVLIDHGIRVEFKEDSDTLDYTAIGIILVIVILFAVIFVMFRLARCEKMLRTYIENTRDVMMEIQSRTVAPDLTSQSAVEKLERITVVSFQGGSAPASHKQMAESVMNRKEVKDLLGERQKTLEMKQVLVNTTADIEKIISSLFVFVFVDHNDAMKILEDQLSKVEKVKTKTVQAALEKSNNVIVVYCWDTKSKDLDLGILYSPRLENSLSHPLLLELRKQQSIYSIYKSFTYFQQCHLTKKFESSFKRSKDMVLVPRGKNSQLQRTTTNQNVRRRIQTR